MSVSGSGCSTSALHPHPHVALETASFLSPDILSRHKFLSRNLYFTGKVRKNAWATCCRGSKIGWVVTVYVCGGAQYANKSTKSISGHSSRLYVCDKGSRLGRQLIAHSPRPAQLSDFHRLFWQEGSGVQGMIKNAKTVLNQHNSDLVRPFFFSYPEREAHRL